MSSKRLSKDSGPPGSVAVEMPAEQHHESVDLLDAIPPERQVTLIFENVSGWVPKMFVTPGILPKFAKPKVEKADLRQIMYGVSGTCKPGSVLALMGPSGSGKTSLLSVLGGRTPDAVTLEGKVLFNSEPLTKRVKRKVGFVLQDDLLFESLTVYETLYYAAMLRLPASMSNAAKKERVEVVLKALGLSKCRNTIIGGFFMRGVSGGERKRVSVGHELLIDPAILLLDEPTSGLDATTALLLLGTLRQLAKGGRAVITTIHQPASRLYQMLDKLMLLSEGHVIYYGDALSVAEWFRKLGYTMPYGINAADFILDLASGVVTTKKQDGEASRVHCIACAERYLAAHPMGYDQGSAITEAELGSELWFSAQSRKKLDPVGDAEAHLVLNTNTSAADSSTSGDDEDLELGKPRNQNYPRTGGPQPVGANTAGGNPSASPVPYKESRWGASYPNQIRLLLSRTLKTRRFEALAQEDICQFIIVGVLSGLFWLRSGAGNSLYGAQNANGLLFFEMMFVSMRAMLGALFAFPPQFKIMVKERASGMYCVSSFYWARMLSDIPIDCSLPSVLIILVYWMGGLRSTAAAFFANWASIILLLLVAQSLGLVIGALIPKPKTAQAVTTVTALTMVLVAGFFVTSIHSWISWLKYISFIYYGYSLLLHIEYRGRTLYNCDLPNPATNPACTGYSGKALQDELHLNRNPNEWPWEALALIGFLLFLRAMVYLSLRFKTKTKVR